MAMTNNGVKHRCRREVAPLWIEVKFCVHEGHRRSQKQQAFGEFGGSYDNR